MSDMPLQKTTGEKLEGVAFQFCKVATVALIAGRYTLPVASTLAAILYLSAHLKGKRDTRCVLGNPIVVASFWGVVSVVAWAVIFDPDLPRRALRTIGIGA